MEQTPCDPFPSFESPMFFRLLLLFFTVPLVELYLLLQFASITNVPTTIAVVILTAVVGAALAKRQGVLAVWRFRQALAEGRAPAAEAADAVLIVLAAALLLIPGLLTDLIGLALLIPASRHYIRGWLLRRLSGKFQVRTYIGSSQRYSDEGETIDANFRRSDEPAPAEPRRIGQ